MKALRMAGWSGISAHLSASGTGRDGAGSPPPMSLAFEPLVVFSAAFLSVRLLFLSFQLRSPRDGEPQKSLPTWHPRCWAGTKPPAISAVEGTAVGGSTEASKP